MAEASTITMAKDLKLPLEIITQTVAFMGKKESGKTYGAGKLCEGMLEVGAQVVVLDPVGNWFNLRLSADGKKEGFKIPVFGGDYADVPLEAKAGKLIAGIIVEKGISAILDVSDFSQGERKGFVKDFSNELMRLKKKKRSPMHLFLEECRYFVPQKPQKGEEPMLGAVSSIVRKGRNYGIGATLMDQRPASVNKEVLSQVEVLFALQLTHALDRKAIEVWVRTTDFAMENIFKDLPTLNPGQAWFWSPGWLKVCKLIKIAKKKTFDGSATPKFGEDLSKQVVLTKLDMDMLRDSMTDMIERAKAEDPKELRREIAQLKKELKKKSAGSIEIETIKLKEIEIPVMDPELVAKFCRGVDRAVKQMQDSAAEWSKRGGRLQQQADLITASVESARRMLKVADAGRVVQEISVMGAKSRKANGHSNGCKPSGTAPMSRVKIDDAEATKIGGGAVKIMKAIAMLGEGVQVSRPQVAMLAVVKHTTGTFKNNVSILRVAGMIADGANKTLVLTKEGRQYLGDSIPDAPDSTEEMVSLWKAKLGGRCGDILDLLVEVYPDGHDRETIAESLGISHTTGTFKNYLSMLRTCGLLRDEKIDGSSVAFAHDNLFPSA